jgi:hypothetical protein
MLLSEFKINNKIKFNNGEVNIEFNNLDGKEVKFKTLNIELLKKMNDEILSKINGADINETLYLILPYLTDLEIDISLEEFEKMVQLPSKEFVQLCEALIDEISLLIDTSKQIMKLNKKSEDIMKKLSKLKDVK